MRFAAAVPPEEVKPASFDNRVVGWFNQPFNRPDGMGTISVADSTSTISHSDRITSFEVLDYDRILVKVGTFAFAGSARDDDDVSF